MFYFLITRRKHLKKIKVCQHIKHKGNKNTKNREKSRKCTSKRGALFLRGTSANRYVAKERYLLRLGAIPRNSWRAWRAPGLPKGAQISSKPQTTTGQNFWQFAHTKSKLTPLESSWNKLCNGVMSRSGMQTVKSSVPLHFAIFESILSEFERFSAT